MSPVEHGFRKPGEARVAVELLGHDARPLHRSERAVDLRSFTPNGKECDGDGCIVAARRVDRHGELQPSGPAPITGFAVLHAGRVLRPGATVEAQRHGVGLVIDAAAGVERVEAVLGGRRRRGEQDRRPAALRAPPAARERTRPDRGRRRPHGHPRGVAALAGRPARGAR